VFHTINLGNLPSFLTITHTTLSAKWFRRYGILTIDVAAEFCSWTDQRPKRIFNFWSWIDQNSESPEYHFGRQHSQLSDGLTNGSNRLTICELRQSETRPVAKTIFLVDHTYMYKTGFWQNFSMTSPETLYMKNAVIELNFPLVTHMADSDTQFGRYGFLKSGYGAELILDRTDRWVNFSGLSPKKRESWRGLFTDYVDQLTSFHVPTCTHIFGNHSNGYGHLKTADMRSFVDCRKSDSSTASKLGFDFRNDENCDF
jgi:hypothetical protein